MRRRVIITVSLVLVAAAAIASSACSESTDGVTPDAATTPGADGSTGQPGDTPSDGGTKGDTNAPLTTGDSSVLVNEIAASAEWIEITSSGTTAVDVSGFRLADKEKDGGAPKLEEAVTFPAGTVLAPKSFLIVQGGGLDGGGKACPAGGQSYCFKAEFGISNKNGETLFLLDKGGAVVGTAVYPPAAATAEETWSRLPSGDPTGAFAKGAPTPGAVNVAK